MNGCPILPSKCGSISHLSRSSCFVLMSCIYDVPLSVPAHSTRDGNQDLLTLSSVIVATGLIVLVDDCIRRRWHHGHRLPARSAFARRMERMGPRRLIGEVLQRRGSA